MKSISSVRVLAAEHLDRSGSRNTTEITPHNRFHAIYLWEVGLDIKRHRKRARDTESKKGRELEKLSCDVGTLERVHVLCLVTGDNVADGAELLKVGWQGSWFWNVDSS